MISLSRPEPPSMIRSENNSDISSTSLVVDLIFCMQFTPQVTSGVIEILKKWAILSNDRLFRQFSEPRLTDVAVSDSFRKGFSCPTEEKNFFGNSILI